MPAAGVRQGQGRARRATSSRRQRVAGERMPARRARCVFVVDVTDGEDAVRRRHLQRAGGEPATSARAAGASARTRPTRIMPPMYYGRDGVPRATSMPACARWTSAIRSIRREVGYYIPAITDKTDKRCVKRRAASAARSRSRPTTSRWTTAATSTPSTGPTPACTSWSSNARWTLASRERCALVTGASMGIGRASAVALAKEGVKLAVAARRRDLLEELQKETGRSSSSSRTCSPTERPSASPKPR